MKRKFLKYLTLSIVPFIFTGCVSFNKHDYNDNKLIASQGESYSVGSYNISPMKDGRIQGKIKKLDGVRKVLEANVSEDTEATLHISITADSGKAKLVLVKQNSEIDVLTEVVSGKENNHFEGDLSVRCLLGVNEIKIVGENYSGNFEIHQPNAVIFNIVTKNKNKDKRQSENSDMFGENFPFENESLHTQENKSKIFVNEKNLNEFKSVKIISLSDNINFVPSDSYGLEICEPDYFDEPKWSIENDQLEVLTNNNNQSNFGSSNSEKRYIKVYYPKNSSFENILINVSSGDINIPDTKVKRLETNVVAGNVDVVLGDCNEILSHSDSGTINVKNNSETPTIVDAETLAGNINLEGKDWNFLKAKSSSGNVKIIGKLNGQSTLETMSGNIDLYCNEDISNYSYNASTNFGSITVNGKKFNKLAKSSELNNPNLIVAKAESGNIQIDFRK